MGPTVSVAIKWIVDSGHAFIPPSQITELHLCALRKLIRVQSASGRGRRYIVAPRIVSIRDANLSRHLVRVQSLYASTVPINDYSSLGKASLATDDHSSSSFHLVEQFLLSHELTPATLFSSTLFNVAQFLFVSLQVLVLAPGSLRIHCSLLVSLHG